MSEGQCLAREIRAVAPQSIDVETATVAVMTRCHWGEALEKRLAAEWPGFRDYIHDQTTKKRREEAEHIRDEIVVVRTEQAGR